MTTENAIQVAAATSFEAFYDQHKTWAMRFAWLMVRDATLAEDIVHDAFTKVLERFDSLTNPSAYLRSTLTNAVYERSRRSSREERRLRLVSASELSHAEQPSGGLMDAISRLPVRQRTAVVLRYWVDLPVAEIAEAMNTRPGTVKSWLSRASTQLRKELEQ
ncbi:MAG: RNA polymerase sigma factor [Ilumatobacter sp.]|uniref:RNA polymerase sigma factor n=1 Tax=Ilumatobacter sp. TaxID=1967498 RepID=UPI0032985507